MKAEELSEKYKAYREECGIKDPIMLDEIEEAYYEGYLQAEKVLVLTEKDIENIKDIIADVTIEHLKTSKWSTTNTFNQEVLNRFNKLKGR